LKYYKIAWSKTCVATRYCLPIKLFVTLLLVGGFSTDSLAANFLKNTPYEVCFTPQQNCTSLIINTIQKAQQQIHLQAYSFTSYPILEALRQAQKRGVQVRIILDKSQLTQSSLITKLKQSRIPVWIDQPSGIAHNKILIIDQNCVITGSFNFTYAAQHRNVENILIVYDKQLAKLYLQNWYRRQAQAVPLRAAAAPRSKSFSFNWKELKQLLYPLFALTPEKH
jgi:phospholipase D